VKLTCFDCGKPFAVSADQAGTEVTCPHCRGIIRLPATEGEDGCAQEESYEVGGGWLSKSVSSLVSFVFHLTLLLLCAAITCNDRDGGGMGDEVQIGVLPDVQLSSNPNERLDTREAEAKSEEGSERDGTLVEVAPVDTYAGDETVQVPLLPAAPSGAATGGQIGAITGGGGALGEGATFMGTKATGRRFCIIADKSGSMAGPKLEHVKEEILETVRSLKSGTRVQLVFFSSRKMPYPKPDWLHPRKELPELEDWLEEVSGGGATYPTPAFRVAFKLDPPPDAIFFMTDGLFYAGVVDEVASLNRKGQRRVVIHTISFMDRSAEALMQEIARDSGGTYRHVSGF